MDPQLHHQLDRLEAMEIEQQREKLRSTFQTLYGHPAPDEWLDEALRPESDLVPPEASATPVVPVSSPAPATKGSLGVMWIRTALASALVGGGLVFGVAGLLGHDGLPVDQWAGLSGRFIQEGMLGLLAGALMAPWRGLLAWAKTNRRWWIHRHKRPIKEWAGEQVLGPMIIAMPAGVILAMMMGLSQMNQSLVRDFGAFQAQRAELDHLFQTTTAAADPSALPDRLPHDGNTRQVFRAHLDTVDQRPTGNLGQLLNGAQAAIGYDRGCLTDQELFTRENAYWRRARAWAPPAIVPGVGDNARRVSSRAGLSPLEWCTLTREWPVSASPATRASACAELSSSDHLDHPVSLASLGVKVPPAAAPSKS